jgi:hypothetical protein
MATKVEDIWKEVVSILKHSTVLGAYVQEIDEGVREDVPKYPAIILEPIREDEVQHTVPQYKRITFHISITCWIEVYTRDKQIVGEKSDIGVLDIARDVKNELSKFQNLNGKAIKIDFPNTTYVFETYPYRSAEVLMTAEFITQSTSR